MRKEQSHKMAFLFPNSRVTRVEFCCLGGGGAWSMHSLLKRAPPTFCGQYVLGSVSRKEETESLWWTAGLVTEFWSMESGSRLLRRQERPRSHRQLIFGYLCHIILFPRVHLYSCKYKQVWKPSKYPHCWKQQQNTSFKQAFSWEWSRYELPVSFSYSNETRLWHYNARYQSLKPVKPYGVYIPKNEPCIVHLGL